MKDRWIEHKGRTATVGSVKLKIRSWGFLFCNLSMGATVLDYTSTPNLASACLLHGSRYFTYKNNWKVIQAGFVDYVINLRPKTLKKILLAIDPVSFYAMYTHHSSIPQDQTFSVLQAPEAVAGPDDHVSNKEHII